MTLPRAAKVLDNSEPEPAVSAGNEWRILNSLEFQFAHASQCSDSMFREITDFLDAQDTSHPFQFPQWSGTGAHLALLRGKGHVRWFAWCGMLYPAGKALRPIRALTVNRGPVGDDPELMEAGLRRLVEESRRKGFAFIDIAPEWTGQFVESAGGMLARNGWQAIPAARSSLRLDLRPDADRLLGNFRKVTRYEIRRSERQGVEVRMARDESDIDDFCQLYRDMAAEKQFVAEDSQHLRHVLRWLGTEKDRGGLFVAHKDERPLGGVVIVRSGARCWYVLGATAKDSKSSAGHLLQWHAIQWAREVGCKEYDFGGYREGASSGPAFFKRGFCENVVHFLPAHRYIVDVNRYRLSVLIARMRGVLRRST